MGTFLILVICILSSPRNTLQVMDRQIPYPPTNKGCEIQNTVLENSINLCCSACPPGTSKVKSCTQSQDTECKNCSENSYTEVWNYISGCNSCRGICKAELGLIQFQDCTAKTRRTCICNHGSYCQTGVQEGDTTCSHCLPHTPCGPGEGVSMPGNYSANTVCQPCPSGTFSNVTSTTHRCQTRTNCSSLGMETSRPGNATADSECQKQTDRWQRRVGQEKIDSSPAPLVVLSTMLFFILVIVAGICFIQGLHRQHTVQLACFKKVFKTCTSDPEVPEADYKSLEVTHAELLQTTENPQRQIPAPSDSNLTVENETHQQRVCEATARSTAQTSDKQAGNSETPHSIKLEDGGVKSTGVIGPVYIYNPSRVYVGVISGHRDLRRSIQARDETGTNEGTLRYPQEEQGTCEREMGEFPQQECGKDSHISESVSENP